MEEKKLLITLVGSNPLPIFVSIEALKELKLHSFDVVLFVVSSSTVKYANAIIKKLDPLGNTFPYALCDLGEAHREANTIYRKLLDKLNAYEYANTAISQIHFNYTGGTKTMALHTYRALCTYIAKHDKVTLILSDLDPDSHKLSITEGDKHHRIPENGTLLDSIACTLDDVVTLHGLENKDPGDNSTHGTENFGMNMPNLYSQLIEAMCKDARLFNEYHKNWQVHRNCTKVKDDHQKLLGICCPNSNANEFQNVQEALGIPSIEEFRTYGDSPDWQSNLYDFCKFIDGIWLERFVYDTIQQLVEDKIIHLNDVRMGYEVKLSDNRKSELDVIIIQGYQLTLISCTTSCKIGLIKQKAFEAIYRAKQLGGEQANTVIVSFIKNVADRANDENNLECLRDDLKAFELYDKVTLIGADNLLKTISRAPAAPETKTLQELILSILK